MYSTFLLDSDIKGDTRVRAGFLSYPGSLSGPELKLMCVCVLVPCIVGTRLPFGDKKQVFIIEIIKF